MAFDLSSAGEGAVHFGQRPRRKDSVKRRNGGVEELTCEDEALDSGRDQRMNHGVGEPAPQSLFVSRFCFHDFFWAGLWGMTGD